MRDHFWKGLLWGSMAGALISAVMMPMVRPQHKPLMNSTSEDILRGTRRVGRRIMRKFI